VLNKYAHYVDCLHIFLWRNADISDESWGQVRDMLRLTANLHHLAIELGLL
jgi:hypothetical protein